MKVIDLLNLSEELGEYYLANLEDKLKNQLKILINDLEKYFEKKCLKENKVLSNSVYKSILPFSYKTRIKSKLSIEEKIIRNDIKLESINENVILEKFDDLIGITILTTTMGYQDLALEFLQSFIEENKETIKLVSSSDEKKSLFKNDRIGYYHIKLIYNGYPVEIQIKSIFLSAFADIDHSLFYKDHDIHELKSYNKKIMHSLAPILIDLEEILHGIYTHDKKYIKSELLKTEIYEYLNGNKSQIFSIEEEQDRGRLNFILSRATELLYVYYKEKDEMFDKSKTPKGMAECRDLKIIQFLYSDSIPYFVISTILDDESDFFRNYLYTELKNDPSYHEKIHLIDDYLIRYLKSLEYISDTEIFKSLQLEKNMQIKKIFEVFVNLTEHFDEKFQDLLDNEEIEEDILNFVIACLVIPSLVKDRSELKMSIGPKVEEYFKTQEKEELIDLDLSETIQEYISERWNNK
ncbi:hypothetical protein AB1282_23780 [Gottfriedia sp. S16(2024)]|uniref:hypothetical protein n=1 Tax=Gottfriedia sp. S16(2024) TaxID=3162883 RepID=UPI003D201FEF